MLFGLFFDFDTRYLLLIGHTRIHNFLIYFFFLICLVTPVTQFTRVLASFYFDICC